MGWEVIARKCLVSFNVQDYVKWFVVVQAVEVTVNEFLFVDLDMEFSGAYFSACVLREGLCGCQNNLMCRISVYWVWILNVCVYLSMPFTLLLHMHISRFFGRLGPKPATPLSEVNPAASAAEKVAPDQAAVSQPDQYEEGQIPQASSGAAEGEAMPGKAGNAPAPASEASAQQSRSFFRLKPAVDASQEDVWVGVCFDEAVGDGDGVHQSVRHFQCQPGHGAFFKASTRQVRVMDDITPTGQCYSMLCRNNRVTTCYSPACRAISRLDNTARRYVASQYPQPKAKK
eukprot:m.326293 g.326293  ORF g.326293 m.326293 type:complete len:287 (+) comp16021_c0_seq2:1796-2656(+)